MLTPTGGREDIRDLLGMRTRGAWLIIGSYLIAMVIVTVATVNSYTTPWVAALGPVILIAATLALVLVPGDPLPFGTTLALTAIASTIGIALSIGGAATARCTTGCIPTS